jgi:hypothetical protein
VNVCPPISSVSQQLPFFDPAFSWQTFEALLCDFFNAQPRLPISRGGNEIIGQVIRARARKIGPSCYEAIFQKLTHVGGGRGSINNEPDEEWKALLTSLERAATKYADDGELGSLFSTMAKYERAWMDSERSWRVIDDEE